MQSHESEAALRTIAMPADANPSGDIFGGWLLSQMDLAGGSVAGRHAGGRVVTVAIDAMTFHQPVEVGDEISCYAQIVHTGTTSLTICVEAYKRKRERAERTKVTEGVFTYVRINNERRPVPIQPQD